MAKAKSRGQHADTLAGMMDFEDVLGRRLAREIAKRLSPEAAERLASLSLAERAALVKQAEGIIDRLARVWGAA